MRTKIGSNNSVNRIDTCNHRHKNKLTLRSICYYPRSFTLNTYILDPLTSNNTLYYHSLQILTLFLLLFTIFFYCKNNAKKSFIRREERQWKKKPRKRVETVHRKYSHKVFLLRVLYKVCCWKKSWSPFFLVIVRQLGPRTHQQNSRSWKPKNFLQ